MKINRRCSGSIIDKNWIITAAHCVVGPLRSVRVYHTSEYFTTKLIARVDPQNVFNKDFVKGSKTVSNEENDLALLKTRRPITFNDNIEPVLLASYPMEFGQVGIIAGYGKSESNASKPREGAVRIIDCKYTIGTDLLCSVGAVRAGSGDSGGPLISEGRLHGIITQSCSDVEINKFCVTIYVDVVVNLNWIQNVMDSSIKTQVF
ncbi:alpha-fibrinogenase-like [Bombyx mori]